jgi:hypothetical protein
LRWVSSGFVLASLAASQLSAAAAQADAPVPAPILPAEVTETSGLAIGVSFPTGAGLIGVRANYWVQVPRSFYRWGVEAGVGAYLCPASDAQAECHASAVFGALGSWGHRHRFVFEFLGGTLDGLSITLHGRTAASRTLWGLGATVGYEYMAESGFFLRFGIGIAYLFGIEIEPFSQRLDPVATLLHVGFKLW